MFTLFYKPAKALQVKKSPKLLRIKKQGWATEEEGERKTPSPDVPLFYKPAKALQAKKSPKQKTAILQKTRTTHQIKSKTANRKL